MSGTRSASRRLVALTLAGSAVLLSSGCAAYEAVRVVDLREVPQERTVLRANDESPAPMFIDTSPALVAKRQIETAISVDPPFEDYLERELEAALGADVATVEIEYVGYRYAYYFPSRIDDFVLSVVVDAPEARIAGEFEVRIRGNERASWQPDLGENWINLVPVTGAEEEEDESVSRLEWRADQIAFIHRLKLIEVTRRLTGKVAGAERL